MTNAGIRSPARRRSPMRSAPLRGRGHVGLEAEPLQHLGDVLRELSLIVDDQYASGFHIRTVPTVDGASTAAVSGS